MVNMEALKVYRDEPGKCSQCEQGQVLLVNVDVCEYCWAMNYLAFRHAMNWPMDDRAWRAIGMEPPGGKK